MTRPLSVRSILCLLSLLLQPTLAHAAGFYLMPRGSRGVAQGGAVVAGANDPDALWYNPAGLVDSGKQVLFDLSLPIERFSFTRIDSGGQPQPTIEAPSAILPLPGMGFSWPLGRDDLVMGLGLFAPPSTMLRYPRGITDTQTGETRPPPQGYSVVSTSGSALLFTSLGLAYRPHPALSIGASFDLLVGQFAAELLSYLADPGSMGPPENPAYSRPTRFSLGPFARPTGKFGMKLHVHELSRSLRIPVTVGASFTLPVAVEGNGNFDIELPQDGLFRDAELSSSRVHVRMNLPWIVRAGVELKPRVDVRLEAAFTYEAWSVQKEIDVNSNIRIEGVPVLQSYKVGDVTLQRNLQDTWSVGLGGRWQMSPHWLVRSGGWFETSSMTARSMSPLIPDTDKLGLSLSVGYELFDGLWVDLVYGHLFMWDRNVPAGQNQIYRLEALRPSLTPCADGQVGAGCPVALGDGDYGFEADYVALGVRWRLPNR